MLSLCPPCILLRARQRPKPSSDTASQKPSGFQFLFLSKKRHIITRPPPMWSGPKSRLWPLQGCKVNKLYSKIGLILSFWPAKRTSPSKKTPSTTGSSTPSPPTSANGKRRTAPSTSAPAMRRFMMIDFCYFSSRVVSARSSFRSNSYFVWQKWQTTSHFGSSSRSFTSSLRPRLRSISFVRSLLQSH